MCVAAPNPSTRHSETLAMFYSYLILGNNKNKTTQGHSGSVSERNSTVHTPHCPSPWWLPHGRLLNNRSKTEHKTKFSYYKKSLNFNLFSPKKIPFSLFYFFFIVLPKFREIPLHLATLIVGITNGTNNSMFALIV